VVSVEELLVGVYAVFLGNWIILVDLALSISPLFERVEKKIPRQWVSTRHLRQPGKVYIRIRVSPLTP
jgi:hypothetical protein